MRTIGSLLLFSLAACTPAVADLAAADGSGGDDGLVVGDDGTDGGDDGTDGGDGGTDGTDGGDGGDGDDGPDYSGSYRGSGSMGVYYTDYPDYYAICEIETVVEVTADGSFEAEANCEIEVRGPDWDVTGTWEGTVADDGSLTGEMEMLIDDDDGEFEIELDLSGSVAEGGALQLNATAEEFDDEGYSLTWFSEVEAN